MAKPRVFVSSTYYDLKHIRASLETFIQSLGFESVLSEKGNIAYDPDAPLDESCYREVGNSDILLLILGGRYGSETSRGEGELPKDFYSRYDSITKLEYQHAVSTDIPLYVLIEAPVDSEYQTFLKNKDSQDIAYAHVDSVNIFHLIDEIKRQSRNNPIYAFERYSDIETWLREQWAGLFRELLSKRASHRQISTLGEQVSLLAEQNKTLRTYLESLLKGTTPEESVGVISAEVQRLKDAERLSRFTANDFVEFLKSNHNISSDEALEHLLRAKNVAEFLEIIKSAKGEGTADAVEETIRSSRNAQTDLNDAIVILERKPFTFSKKFLRTSATGKDQGGLDG